MATNPPHEHLRVMMDANLLIAGTGWPRFAYEVLQHLVSSDKDLTNPQRTRASASQDRPARRILTAGNGLNERAA